MRVGRWVSGAWLCATALLAVLPGSAAASLIGDVVGCLDPPGVFTCQPGIFTVVEPGADLFIRQSGTFGFSVDIHANSIELTAMRALTLNLTVIDFVDLDPGGIITGVNLSLTGTTTGVAPGDITFGDHSITFDLVGTTFASGAKATLTLVTTQVPVPTPGAVGFLGAGLLALAALRKRLSF